MSAAAVRVAVCAPGVHAYLRTHPEDLLQVQPWREIHGDLGTCPGCKTSLRVPWFRLPPPLADAVERASAHTRALCPTCAAACFIAGMVVIVERW